ncbi:hypothetical protein [Bartonella queenslandensis]
MKKSDLDHNIQNISFNDNDNTSHKNTCLEAIPYKEALQQNGWGK